MSWRGAATNEFLEAFEAFPETVQDELLAYARLLEKQIDMYLSALRGNIEAMGSQLDVVATLPDRGPIKIQISIDVRRCQGHPLHMTDGDP